MMKLNIKHNSTSSPRELEFKASPTYPEIFNVRNGMIYNTFVLNRHILQQRKGFYKWHCDLNRLDISKISNIEQVYLDSNCLNCLHFFQTNYAHFTIQCLSAYIVAKEAGLIDKKTKILIDTSKRFQRELIQLFGIDKLNVITPEQNKLYVAHNLICVDTVFSTNYNKDLICLYSQMCKADYIETPPKFYITRINQSNRKMTNESECIKLVKELGYSIVDFDKESVTTQINYMRNAEEIITPHGAAGANFVYLNQMPVKIVEIFSQGRLDSFNANILQNFNVSYSAIACKSTPIDIMDGPYNLDLNLIEPAIAEADIVFKSSHGRKYINAIQSIIDFALHNDLITPSHKIQEMAIALSKGRKIAVVVNECDKLLALYPNNRSLYSSILNLFIRSGHADQIIDYIDKYSNNTLYTQINIKFKSLYYLYRFDYDKSLSEVQSLKEIESKTYDYIIQLNDYFASAPNNCLISFHHTILYFDQDTKCLVNKTHNDNAVQFEIVDDNNIHIKYNDIYISAINEQGIVTFSHTPVRISYIRNGQNNISILQDQKFWSARRDGSIFLIENNLEWEHWWINQNN